MSDSPPSFKPLLLVRPTPDSREGTREYLQRLAKKNGFESSKEIAALLGIPLGHLFTHCLDKVMAVVNGTDAPESLRLPPSHQPSTRKFGGTVGIPVSARVCSRCLSENEILSAEWSLPLSISCNRHKTVLLDRCPSCLNSIQRTHSLSRCRCGQDFREVDSQPTPLWEKTYYELFAPWRTTPRLPVSANNFFRVETLAGRVTRRLIRAYESEIQTQTPRPLDRPHWWIRSVDHRFLETICEDHKTLADITLRLFPGFTTLSKNLYARLTAEVTTVQPRILLLALQLDAERGVTRPRNRQQIREARKARTTRLHELAAAMDVSPSTVSKRLRDSWRS